MRKKESQEKNIQVVVRCRPRSSQEIKDCSPTILECLPSKKEVSVKHDIADKSSITKTFGFDRVFDPSASQLDVYRYVVCPLLEEVLLGYNCTVFAYGQTGTGKTFTMEGEKGSEGGSWDKEPNAGIVPRAMQQLFEQLEAMPDCEFSVRVSFLEIYNEDLFDLLGSTLDSQKLRIFEDSARKGSVFVQGIEETIVRDKNEVYEILERGRAKRQTAATLMNAHSSRSHSLFSVTVHIKESSLSGEEMLKTGKLNLVDLAGSENVGRSGAVDKRLREAGTINQSLLTLGRVITALVERAPHIPYRESKLTRLLQDSLGGRTKTTIIATISPASCNVEETLSTLDYAHRAKNILNRPEINQKLTKKTLIKEYTEEIDKLKKDLLAAREKNGIYLAIENYNEMQNKLKSQAETLSNTHEKLSHLESEFAKISELFRNTSEELTETTVNLEKTHGELRETRNNLKSTIEDRDGLDFVLKEYDQTEANLFARSTALLKTVKNICGDIDKLHFTLERKAQVEKTNSKQKKIYRDEFSECISDLQQTVVDYCKKEELRTQAHLSWLQNEMTEKNKLVSEQREFINDMFTRRTQLMSKILETGKTHVSSCEEWKETLSQAMDNKKDEVIELLRLVCSDQWNYAVDFVTNSYETTQNHLRHIQTFISQKNAEREEIINEYLEEKRNAMKTIEERMDQYMNEKTKMIEMQSQNHERKKNEIRQYTMNMQKFIEQLSATVESQSKTFETYWEKEENVFSQDDAAKLAVVEDTRRTLTSLPRHDETLVNVMTSHDNETSNGIDQTFQQVSELLERSATLHKNVEDTGVSVRKNGVRMAGEWKELIHDSLTDRMACISRNYSVQQQHFEDYSKISRSDYDTLGENLTFDEQQFSTVIKTSEETSRDVVESRRSLRSLHTEKTASLENKMSTFIDVELLEDISTGTTPVRQQYKYSTFLPRTENRTKLLQLFKENYEVPTTPQLESRGKKLENREIMHPEDVFFNNSAVGSTLNGETAGSEPSSYNQEEEKENIGFDQDYPEQKRKKAEEFDGIKRNVGKLRENNSASDVIKRSRLPRSQNTSKSQ